MLSRLLQCVRGSVSGALLTRPLQAKPVEGVVILTARTCRLVGTGEATAGMVTLAMEVCAQRSAREQAVHGLIRGAARDRDVVALAIEGCARDAHRWQARRIASHRLLDVLVLLATQKIGRREPPGVVGAHGRALRPV